MAPESRALLGRELDHQIGGFVAIPALLVVYAIIRNIVPGIDWGLDDFDRKYG